MAGVSSETHDLTSQSNINDVKLLLWGTNIKDDVFRRWSQGFMWSDDEPSALEQYEGGPCAVIAPVQAFFLKNLLFRSKFTKNWRQLPEESRGVVFVETLINMFEMLNPTGKEYCIVKRVGQENQEAQYDTKDEQSAEKSIEHESEESRPKKQCFSHEEFHSKLQCIECSNSSELKSKLTQYLPAFHTQYGVILLLYSFILTKGVQQIKNEVEDPAESLIDSTHGHGSQSLINLLITGKAVPNVWDNDKDISGLKLQGVYKRPAIGFLTLLEHLRYLEVGWYLKNPEYPVWLLGSETHLTVLFSPDQSTVSTESPEATARRVFSDFDKEGIGFIMVDLLGDLMAALDLVSESEYVKIMRDKLDPENLGIVTLNSFMEEFFPKETDGQTVTKFVLYHYNGLKRSSVNSKVMYQESEASILEMPEVQIITDSSDIKTCLMTKWPTIELSWLQNQIPSLN